MKLLRHGAVGAEKPGLLAADGTIRDLSGRLPRGHADLDGVMLSPDALAAIAAIDSGSLPVVAAGTRLGPCVANVGQFVAIGLNFSDHAAEAGMAVPTEPIMFMKANGSICGPNDDVIKPPHSIKLDWEVELGIVIGTKAQYIEEADAIDHVAGYCLVNDVSERNFQLERGGTWSKGKGAETFGPIGPWMVTKDEVGDPQALEMWLDLNGEKAQRGNTKTMVFGVAQLVAYVSHYMTLFPGDVITTGTPPGVGMGMKPQRFLNPGDVMTLGIDKLGEQRQRVVAWHR
ncbi:MAG: FAA hydrolase family protein [Betaproteobacteria bacterium]|jgi:2-keto-4-pentenoate hydratase/2-oxohepta-3-ene-1,7-dioic acid hydratase in catechol pathway|nr:FAA hydrolase family protein [Betaproteobacteria bacterium]